MDHFGKEAPPRILRWSGQTDRGKVRRNNEDSFLGLQFDAREVRHLGKFGEASTLNSDFAFAVSDGMGGGRAGEFASRITMEKITSMLPCSFKQAAVGLEAGYADVLYEIFDQIHRALTFLGTSDDDCHDMGATLSMCWFTPGWMHFGHVGDSRTYYLPAREGGIKRLTQDDTYVGWLFRKGEINEREARNHPRRNVLQKALGGGHLYVEPQVGSVAYEPGDIFLLCTDGLVDGLYDERILDHLRTPVSGVEADTPAHRIVNASLRESGRDNTTGLVVEVL